MGTNGINEALSAGFKVKLQNRGAKSSGITFELKSVFDEMAKQGLIKDTDGKGLTKQDALNLYDQLNKIHQETNRATNYTTMQVGQEFDYTAEEMKALAKAAGYEVVEQPLTETPPTAPEQSSDPETPSDDGTVTPQQEEPVVTGPSDDPEYEQSRLSLVEADFDVNGQVGKISDGKYYINGKEVSKDVYDTAKAKAMSASAGMLPIPEIKPDEVVPDGVKSVEILKDKIKENRSENRELRADLREMRKEIRQANQTERRKDRLERQEIRQENRFERSLAKVTPTFDYDGNVGKILGGKFYLNGKEVTAREFEIANTKAYAAKNRAELEPFTSEQIADMQVSVLNLKYEFAEDENGNMKLYTQGVVGFLAGPNEITDDIKYIPTYINNNTTDLYNALGKNFDDSYLAYKHKATSARTLSVNHAVYMDLLNKQNSGVELKDYEKAFMEKFEIDIAEFYSYMEPDSFINT